MLRSSLALCSASVVVFALAATGASAREIPGFPARVGGGDPQSSPAVADLDGDGVLDVVVGVGDEVFAVSAAGKTVAGFPVKLGSLPDDAKKVFSSSPALCDLDGTGRRSVVTGGADEALYVLESDGSPRAGFPIRVGAKISAAPLCADVDRDGDMDIVVAVPGKHVIGFDRGGKKLRGFPVRGIVPAESAIAAADLVPGGPLELVVGGDDGRLHVFDGKGRVDASKRARTKYRITGGASLGDVDGDGVFDVVFGSQDFHLYAIDGETGEAKPGFPVKTEYRIYGSPALGDLTGDGVVDIVVGSADGRVYAVDGKGKALPGWPANVDGRVEGAPAIGDVDLDGELEVVALATGGSLHVFEPNGKAVSGTPIKLGGKLVTSPFVVELDGKGTPEIVAVARGELHAFSLRARGKLPAARIPWPTYGHDAERISRTRPNPARFADLRIEPPRARTTDDLTVSYTYADLDGGKERATRIAWFVDGKRVPELDNKRVVPAAMTKKGQKWTVRLQEHDDHRVFGEAAGARFTTSRALEILNTPPVAPSLAAVGAAAGDVRAGDVIEVKIATESSDVDGDRVRYRTRWTIDEAPVKLGKAAMVLPASRATRGQRVAVLVIPSDGAEDGEPAQRAWTLANTAPTPPKVRLEPKEPSRGSGARVVILEGGKDADGDPVHHEIVWRLSGAVLPLVPDAREVPGGLLVRGAKLTAEVVAHDGVAPSSAVVLEAVVGNNAPGAPVVRVVPERPTADTPLGLLVAKPAPDKDGDVARYLVSWKVDGNAAPDLENTWTVPAARLKKGQRWQAFVVADDGSSRGPAASASVEIGNRPPVPPVVAIQPMQPEGEQPLTLEVRRPASDPDGDKVSMRIEWLIDGAPLPASARAGDGVRPGVVKKGQRVAVKVVPTDGKDAGAETGDVVVVGDRPPVAPEVALAPRTPRTGDAISVSIAKPGRDPDGDSIAYRYRWLLDGGLADLPEDATTLPAALTRQGQKVEVEVVAVADGLASPPARAQLVVTSTPPPAPVVAIEPAAPLPGEPLRLRVVKQDADADDKPVRYEVTWRRNGAEGATGPGVEAGKTKKGERWQVEVVALDGDDRAPPVRAEVVIGNQPPKAPRIALAKRRVRTSADVKLEVTRPASDPDGDGVRLEIRWSVDGKRVAELDGKPLVPASLTKKGQRFEVEVNAFDGVARSEVVRERFFVADTPPSAPDVAFRPAKPRAGADVEVAITRPGADVDGDPVEHRVRWLLDGQPVEGPPTAFKLAGRHLSAHRELIADVWTEGGGARSRTTRIRAQVLPAAPEPPRVALEPARPLPGAPLFARVERAKSWGAPGAVELVWARNGQRVDVAGPSVPGELVRRGETWSVSAVAIVDQERSAPASAEVRVGNRPPTAPHIALDARTVTTDRPVRLSIAKPATDPDGDAVSVDIRWTKNGKREASLDGAREVPPTATKKGDRFVVTVIARDGSDAAPAVTDAFTVVDTPPPAVAVRLEPAEPRAGDDVRAVITPPAADVDGDEVTYAVRFLVNGRPAAGHDGKAPKLPAKAFARGDRIVVEVIPHDGERAGPASRAEATAVNTPPVLAGVRVEPATPTPGDALRCVPSQAPSDADGDPVAVYVVWEVDGRAQNAAGPAASLEAGQVPPGAKVRCRAAATDGSAYSKEAVAAAVEVGSRPPSGLEVALFPATPKTGEAVRCGARGAPTDPDGDAIALAVVATVNGRPLAGPVIPAAEVKSGRKIGCRASPRDPRREGLAATVETTVGNARPAPPVPRLSSLWPRQGVDSLSCEVAARADDPEQDKVRYRIEWWRDGRPAGLPPNAREVPAAQLKAGEVWVCRLFAQDDGGEGAPSASSAAVVRTDPSGGVTALVRGGRAPAVQAASGP